MTALQREPLILNESFKVLISSIFNNEEQSKRMIQAFEEALTDRATMQRVNLENLKQQALEDIRSDILTKDLFKSEIKRLENELMGEISRIENELRSEIEILKSNIKKAEIELKSEISKIEAELKSEISRIEVKLKSEIEILKGEISRVEIELKSEIAILKSEIKRVESELRSEIKRVESELKSEIKSEIAIVKSEINALRKDMKFYGIGIAFLIIIFQPKVWEIISKIFG